MLVLWLENRLLMVLQRSIIERNALTLALEEVGYEYRRMVQIL